MPHALQASEPCTEFLNPASAEGTSNIIDSSTIPLHVLEKLDGS